MLFSLLKSMYRRRSALSVRHAENESFIRVDRPSPESNPNLARARRSEEKQGDIAKRLAGLALEREEGLTFTILEVGAVPLDSGPEPFHRLVDWIPGSRILAFEVDQQLCQTLNATAHPSVRFFPTALGRSEEIRQFYVTEHPMCSSLYEPNSDLLELYNNLEVARLRSVQTIETTSLDQFAHRHAIGPVDFVKIDIQGAELEVFKGGKATLEDAVAVICEVEFIPLYRNQPLFGDVCAWMSANGFMFHKFLGLAGRTLSPVVIGKDPNLPSQVMWADAVFIKDVLTIPALTPTKLLKLGLLAHIYDSPDLTYHCLRHYDERQGSECARRYLELLAGYRGE
jgi:FkbM family methyltransferase